MSRLLTDEGTQMIDKQREMFMLSFTVKCYKANHIKFGRQCGEIRTHKSVGVRIISATLGSNLQSLES